MNQTSNRTIALGLLFLGAAGALVYFLTRSKRVAAAVPKTAMPAATTKPTVAQKIAVAYEKGLATLTDAEVKRYATWIDRISQILAQSRTERKSQYGQPTEEALSNADSLNKLSDDNLRAVANYWKAVRGVGLESALDMFTDDSGRLIDLTARLDELGLRK